jgi:hypothetical protein
MHVLVSMYVFMLTHANLYMFILPLLFFSFVVFVCQMDCCHSGTAMDLPYEMNATESKMHSNSHFSVGSMLQEPAALACCACLALCLVDSLLGG